MKNAQDCADYVQTLCNFRWVNEHLWVWVSEKGLGTSTSQIQKMPGLFARTVLFFSLVEPLSGYAQEMVTFLVLKTRVDLRWVEAAHRAHSEK